MFVVTMLSMLAPLTPGDTLEVRLVANAGVVLSDGTTSLLIDLPYRPGAFGYAEYDPASIAPVGDVVVVITHEHRDHFDPDLFLPTDWSLIGGPPVANLVPNDRVITGDSLRVGAFSVVSLSTDHVPGHRSYRIRWQGRVLFFTGDAENPGALLDQPPLDVMFITPWLSCFLHRSTVSFTAGRVIGYHRDPNGSDEFCGQTSLMDPGDTFLLSGMDQAVR